MQAPTSSKPKRRPTNKTEAQLAEEMELYFELPRHKCEEIAPSMLRLKYQQKAEQTRVLRILKRIIKRARYKKASKHIEHIVDFDKSESIIPHGEVSKRIYKDIFKQRDFNLYGGMVKKTAFNRQKIEDLKALASELGVEYTRQQEKVEDAIVVPDIFDNITATLTKPILSTAPWKIGHAETYNPPVGFAPNPAGTLNSEGHDAYFAYDGEWKAGKMHGYGKYLYDDGYTYEGQFRENWPDGEGESIYPFGASYKGNWRRGRYDGIGTFKADGAEYTGNHVFGRRSGYGVMKYPCGLVYEGEWLDGKPHGRGKMSSAQSKYSYEGEFEKGAIRGSGTLITPSGERIVRVWRENITDLSLPMAVRIVLDEEVQNETKYQARQNEMYQAMRGLQLRDYVNAVRLELHNSRMEEKKRRFIEMEEQMKAQQAKLREARLNALAGDMEDDDNED